ncbi:MAG: thiolase domain-containing protein [Methanotrichaceae archaeon]|jgi:acetyl-CoA C-acetyltransferase
MYITGIGRTKFGILDESLPQLLYDAIYRALRDSTLGVEDLDAIVVANFLAGNTQSQLHLGSLVSSLLPGINLPSFRVEAACASGGVAVFQALSLLHAFENILVVGGEKLNVLPNKILYRNIAMAGDLLRDQQEGLIFPAQYAIVASRYLRTYGASLDDLSLISLKNYSNAAYNPLAHFNYKDLTMETIDSSAVVCSPLRLFDCCPISDGAASIIISRERKTSRDVKIIGTGAMTAAISLSQRKEFTTFRAARSAAEVAYIMAGISPEDVDVAEVHDCFTIAELIAMEDLGFCGQGEAVEMVKKDETSLSGRLPINTDGGLLADGHPIGATGIAQICEIVRQLRGDAGERQVREARIGLTHNVGGVGGTAVVHILERCQ